VETLLARQTPEAIAAALIRLFRTHLPEPAPITILAAEPHPRTPRPPRPAPNYAESNNHNAGGGDSSWFRMPVGRKQNADPKWLIPLICRAGNITKQEIGAIRVFDRETKFEILPHASAEFTATLAAGIAGDLNIDPTTPPSPGARGPMGPRPTGPRPPRPEYTTADKPGEQQRRKKNKAAKNIW
jgi:ATP-dependent RNA helicase DeaD